MGRCKHERVDNWGVLLTIVRTKAETCTRTCRDCGIALPIGTANDTPAVLVEVRAAVLAETVGTTRYTTEEYRGWCSAILSSDRTPATDGEWSGWLAYQIAHHGEGDAMREDDVSHGP